MVRVPYGRLELRVGDSAMNPYLATAAMLAAGLDGIERELDPGAPHNINFYGPGVPLSRFLARSESPNRPSANCRPPAGRR